MSQGPFDLILPRLLESTVAVCDGDRLAGSGVMISRRGLLATCLHVVRSARELFVRIGSRRLHAVLHKEDQANDVAILRIPMENVGNHVDLDRLAHPEQGHTALVLGFPATKASVRCGEEPVSVSRAIVSTVQSCGTGSGSSFRINGGVAPGSSGGPVFNLDGDLIGIVTTELSGGFACCVLASVIRQSVTPYELDPGAAPLSEYARRETAKYAAISELNGYVDLKCRIKHGDRRSFIEYVRNVWLPDNSKPLLGVLGEFGSGKTFSCHKLTYELLRDYEAGSKLPVFLRLRDVGQYPNPKDFLLDQVGTRLRIPNLTWFALEGILRTGEVVLIYDGFEEMTPKANMFQMKDSFRGVMSTLVQGTKIILTCRTHYFSTEREELLLTRGTRPDEIESLITEASNPERVTILYLQPFDDQDIERYLRMRVDDWQGMLKKISDPRFYDLADLARRPIFLDLIIEYDLEQPPEEKLTGTHLYQAYTAKCFEREFQRIGLDLDEQSRMMEELAFEAYKERCRFLDRRLVEAVWTKVSGKPNFEADQLIRKYPFLKRAEPSEAGLDFIHQSFFEFFVAKKIFRSLHDHDHALYAAEYLTSPVDKYLFELLDYAGDTQILHSWLARHPDVNVRMNCALTLERSRRAEFIPHLQQCLKHEKDIGVAGRIADALSGLGDTESLTRFLGGLAKYDDMEQVREKPDRQRLLFDIVGPLQGVDPEVIRKVIKNLEHPHPRIRKFAAFTLGRTRAVEGVAGIVALLGNAGEGVRARRYAAAALGIIGSPDAVAALQQVVVDSPSERLRLDCLKAIERIQKAN